MKYITYNLEETAQLFHTEPSTTELQSFNKKLDSLSKDLVIFLDVRGLLQMTDNYGLLVSALLGYDFSRKVVLYGFEAKQNLSEQSQYFLSTLRVVCRAAKKSILVWYSTGDVHTPEFINFESLSDSIKDLIGRIQDAGVLQETYMSAYGSRELVRDSELPTASLLAGIGTGLKSMASKTPHLVSHITRMGIVLPKRGNVIQFYYYFPHPDSAYALNSNVESENTSN